MSNSRSKRIRRGVTLGLAVLGVLFMVLALSADAIGLDITPGFGVIQSVVFLFGLTFLTLASFLHLQSMRPKSSPRSLQADIGVRLAATGLVLAYVAGLSDLIGIGTHVSPNFDRPFIGPLQAGGFVLGLLMIVGGLILFYTSRGPRESSSLEFLVNGRGRKARESEQNN